MITLNDLLALAQAHATRTNNDSARLCVADALKLINTSREEYARGRLLDSLKHSVGICHPSYMLATAESFEVINIKNGEIRLGAAMTYEQAKAQAAESNNAYPPGYGPFAVRPYSSWETAREHPQEWRD
jgi:hypothetical protein